MPSIPVTPSQLPTGFCATDYQNLLNEFSAHQSVDISAGTGTPVIVSSAKPADTTVLWERLDQFGRPDRLYFFASGAWLSLHPLVPGSTLWWFDTLPVFTTFDGGDANPLSAISGPMWQQAKLPNGNVIAAQFPIAAGTLPSGKVLNVGDVGGEEQHTLIAAELPAHAHDEFCADSSADAIGGGGANRRTFGTSASTFIDSGVDTGSIGAGQAHNVMPVYAVGYLLMRTQKLFYAIT